MSESSCRQVHAAEPLVRERDFVEAVARGLAILESFGTERQRLNATQAAERAGLTRAAARRHLLTLTALGYLETDGSSFWLTPKVLRFSGSYLASARLPRLVQSTMNRLSAQSGAAHSMVVRDQNDVVIIARSGQLSRSGPMLPHGLHLGARLPMFATSTGRMLLAGLPRNVQKDWLDELSRKEGGIPRLTSRTTTDPAELGRLIEEARTQGYCMACEEHELGVCAVAVPLIDMQGQTHAALNVVLSATGERAKSLCRQYLPLMQEAAQELRALL